MSKLYTTVERVENYVLRDVEDFFEPEVEKWIESTSRLMDSLANRVLVAPVFGSGDDFEIKYYDGDGTDEIRIDDCQEIESLAIGDEFGDNLEETDEYITRPKIEPFQSIKLKSDVFTKGVQNVKVEGRFGFFNSNVEDIQFACTVLTAGIIMSQIKGKQAVSSESIGNYSVSYFSEQASRDYKHALEIIARYRKLSI